MDFKSLISKIDSIESTAPAAPKLTETKKVQLDEETAIKFLAGTKSLNEAAEIMEKKLTKAEKAKKEEVVKSMKKDKKGFEERYGERGEEVMHATATKIAKKKAESVETNKTAISELDMNLLKAAQKGQEGKPIGKPDPESDKNVTKKYGYRMDGEPAERDDDETKQDRRGRKRKNTGEGIDLEGFRADFLALVEAKKKESKKKKPDADGDGVPDWADEKPGEDDNAAKKTEKKSSKGLSAKQKKLPAGLQKAIAAKKGKKPMKESLDEFFFPDDTEGDGDGEGKSGKDKIVNVQGHDFILRDTPEGMLLIGDDVEGSFYANHNGAEREGSISFVVNLTKGKIEEFPEDYSQFHGYLDVDGVEDFIKMVAREVDMKQAKGESQRRYKKVVAESRETKLSFRDMIKLVHESGGQQQIDPLDKELFAWATRVAQNKLGEGMKAEVYAGLVYERMGGRFEMFDILKENRMVKRKPVMVNGQEVDLNSIEFDIYGTGSDQYEIDNAKFVDGTPLSGREIEQLYSNDTIIDLHQDELEQMVRGGGSGL